MQSRGWILSVLAALVVSGCYDWRGAVVHTAGFEHHCPEERVRILGDDGDAMARSVQLDVCGEERLYRDVGGARAYVWVDYTEGLGDVSARTGSSGAETQRPATETLAYSDTVRARIAAASTSILACTGVDSTAVEAQWSSSGAVAFRIPGQSDPAIDGCIGAAIGVVEVPSGVTPDRLLHPIAR